MPRPEPASLLEAVPPNAVYALCDRSLLERYGVTLSAFADHCRCLDVKVVQYRDKHADAAGAGERLAALREAWDGLLIVNDRVELASFCDGVHVGQEDLSALGGGPAEAVKKIRERIGRGKLIGLSTHNRREIETANTLDIDYIGLGAFRATGTKTDAAVLGEDLDTLAALSRRPVAAIGGVTFGDRFEHARMRVMGRALFERKCP